MNKRMTSCRITGWLLSLQKFNITNIDRPRKFNVVANYLPRLDNPDQVILVDD